MCFRVPLESIQAEAATLIRFLENTQKKVEASSAEDLKENYLSAIKVPTAAHSLWLWGGSVLRVWLW